MTEREKSKTARHIKPQHSHQSEEHVRRVEQSAGILEPIPDGYIGPGVLSIGGLKIPVAIEVYHGADEDDPKRHDYGASLRIGKLVSRIEGSLKGDLFSATPKDIKAFKDKKQ